MSAILHLGKSPTCGSLGVECFQTNLDISGVLCDSSSYISSLSSVQVSGGTYWRSNQTSNSSGTYWMEPSWLPSVLNMLEDLHYHCPIVKNCIMDVLVDLVLKGLPLLHVTLWLLREVCCTDKGSLP